MTKIKHYTLSEGAKHTTGKGNLEHATITIKCFLKRSNNVGPRKEPPAAVTQRLIQTLVDDQKTVLDMFFERAQLEKGSEHTWPHF